MKKQKEYYSLRADIKLNSKRIIKNARAKLNLQGKPDGLAEAVDMICEHYEKTILNK